MRPIRSANLSELLPRWPVTVGVRAALIVGLALLSAMRMEGHAAAATLYASTLVSGSDLLLTLDPKTGRTASLSFIHDDNAVLNAPSDIAFAPNGTLFASTFISGSDLLLTLDPKTGRTTSLSFIHDDNAVLNAPSDIAFAPDGTLFASTLVS